MSLLLSFRWTGGSVHVIRNCTFSSPPPTEYIPRVAILRWQASCKLMGDDDDKLGTWDS